MPHMPNLAGGGALPGALEPSMMHTSAILVLVDLLRARHMQDKVQVEL